MTPTDTTPHSILASLRALSPRRPLNHSEARRVAELQANRLLQLQGVAEWPTPIEVIADLPHVHLQLVDGLPVPGLIQWVPGRWLVSLAATDHPSRLRYSAFHELKHIIDWPVRDLLYRHAHDSEQLSERMAEAFAAHVLMPKRLVIRAWCNGMQSVTGLARAFAVSPEAMRIRLLELGLVERPEPNPSEIEVSRRRSANPRDRAWATTGGTPP